MQQLLKSACQKIKISLKKRPWTDLTEKGKLLLSANHYM